MTLLKYIIHQSKLNLLLALLVFSVVAKAQILTSSPYSRYGLGELNLPTFANSAALGGSFIAYQQDSAVPFFINVANPAGLSGIKFTALELGAQVQFTKISSSTLSLKKKNTNFSYGALAFPLRKISGGGAFGIMPYSSVGYKINSTSEDPNVGTLKYNFEGDGGINKVFLATGFKPFKSNLTKFYKSDRYDTLYAYKQTQKIKNIKFAKQLISELAIGASANYLFGTINQTTDIILPNSLLYYNTKRQRSFQVNDFTFNFGLQTNFTIDSAKYQGSDTLKKGKRIELKEKIKIGTGFYLNTPSSISAKQSNIIYNYNLDGFGVERPKDTVLNSQDNKGEIKLPLEMGIGFSVKKGDKLTFLVDGAITNWSGFKYFNTPSTNFKNSYRASVGINYVPNKRAYGFSNYYKKVQYRIGASYTNGYLDLKNTTIKNYAVTAGLGLPVGNGIALVNISAQYGKMGTISNNLLQEEYVRLIIGFTFNDLWFRRFKYD